MIKVAIIGGGPVGLLAAYFLTQKCQKDCDVTVFEASGRLGGKILSLRFATADVPYEAGVAELYDYSALGPDALRQLLKTLGLKTRPMRGQTVVLDKHILRCRTDIRRYYGMKATPPGIRTAMPCATAFLRKFLLNEIS